MIIITAKIQRTTAKNINDLRYKKRTSLDLDNGDPKHQKDGKNLGISVGVGTEKTKMDANHNSDHANNDDDDDDAGDEEEEEHQRVGFKAIKIA